MKKYIKPIARLVHINPSAILAGSEFGVYQKESDQMLSKQGADSFFDEDEDDE